MPQAYVNKLAKKHGMGVSTAERRWNRAKAAAKSEGHAEDYAYIAGIFKKMMNEGIKISNPKVIDMTKEAPESLYDLTQTNDNIKDGDVLNAGRGNIGIMVDAWPTIAFGKIKGFHTLQAGHTFYTLDGGKYKQSYELAKTLESVKNVMNSKTHNKTKTNEGYNSKREHEYNMDAAQREMDSRDAQGEDMSDAYINPKTYEIKFKKKVKKPVVGEKFTFKDFLMLEQGVK